LEKGTAVQEGDRKLKYIEVKSEEIGTV